MLWVELCVFDWLVYKLIDSFDCIGASFIYTLCDVTCHALNHKNHNPYTDSSSHPTPNSQHQTHLQGGLGTSMGLDKAKSLLAVKGADTFLDLTAKQVGR